MDLRFAAIAAVALIFGSTDSIAQGAAVGARELARLAREDAALADAASASVYLSCQSVRGPLHTISLSPREVDVDDVLFEMIDLTDTTYVLRSVINVLPETTEWIKIDRVNGTYAQREGRGPMGDYQTDAGRCSVAQRQF